MGFAELCSCWNKVLPCWMEQERVRRKQSGHVGQVSFGGSKSDEFIAFPYSILSCSLSLQSLGSLQSKQDVPYPNPPPQEQVSKVFASKYPQKNLVLQHAICYSYANLRTTIISSSALLSLVERSWPPHHSPRRHPHSSHVQPTSESH